MDNKNQSTEQVTPVQTELATPKKERTVNRRFRYGALATALTVLVIVAVVLANVGVRLLETAYPLNLDLTKDETFTLSEDTLKVVSDVQEDVEVIVFQDESFYRTPSGFTDEVHTVIRQFYEGMRQCQSATDGRVSTTYINYADNPTLVKPYAKYEVDENSILFLCGDRFSVIELTDLFNYEEMVQYYQTYYTFPTVESYVDRQIATHLMKVTGHLAPVVVMVGHDENPYTLNDLTTVLENNAYTVETCDLTKSEKISEDAITIVFPAPATDYSHEEIATINAWLQQNGEYSRNLVLFTDYTADCPNLYELVNEEYGIEVTDTVVRETVSYYNNPYLAYGDIPSEPLAGDVQGSKVLVSYAQKLVLHKDNNKELSLYNMPIVTFGDTAQLVDIPDELTDKEPTPYNSETYPVVGVAVAHKQVPSPTINMTVSSYAAVFGSSDFLAEEVRKYVYTAENEALFMNVFNELSGAKNAVTISSRSMDSVLLTYEAGTAKWLGLGVFAIGLPLITLVLGIAIFLRRRHL